MTVANYGDILLTENPANGALNLQVLETNTYRGWNYAYDAIGNLERLSRNGFIGGPTCEWGMIDDLSYSYDAQRAHLTGVADAAPLPGRDKGFKPNPGAGAYLYDYNGNMTFDPHKDITITYNFLNLPSQINKTGAGGGTMSLTYDAAGRKWRKQVTGVTKDYCQGIEYKDGKVEAVYGAEGRLTAVYDEYGVTLTRFRAEYWLKDHLGNTRLAFADENHNGTIEVWDDPSTPENEAEITQAKRSGVPHRRKEVGKNHAHPPAIAVLSLECPPDIHFCENRSLTFGMNQEGPWYATIGPRNGYQYNGKELNEELELGWNDFGARWQDPATGRWWQVDLLAELNHNLPLTPYHYVANNPILNIDPDGLDWYQNSDGATIWLNSRDGTYTDDDGNEWKNIGEELLFFGSENLIYYTQSADENGDLTLETYVFDAVSGAALEDGSFEYSLERQAEKDQGPLPEGEYTVNPSAIQNWSDLSFVQKTAAIIRKGTWPGGPIAWGSHRVWINPYEVDVTHPVTGEEVRRTGFTIHGGSIPGSVGCIDLSTQDKAFFRKLRQSNQAAIKLIVRYPRAK